MSSPPVRVDIVRAYPDTRWDDDALNQLKSIRGADFEVVDTSSLMVSPASGEARQ